MPAISIDERCHRLGPDAFGTEEQQAKPDQREMQRDRDGQQQQHRGVGDRTEHDAIEQRRDRHDQQQGEDDADRQRRIEFGRQPEQCRPTISGSAR